MSAKKPSNPKSSGKGTKPVTKGYNPPPPPKKK